jgi:hypothetical protein
MHCPYAFDLAGARTSQLGCALDSLTSAAKRNNMLVGRSVGHTTGVFASRFGKLDALMLPFAAGHVVRVAPMYLHHVRFIATLECLSGS